MEDTIFIIDFDSTFISKEALDVLADVSLKNSSKKQKILTEIQNITKQGMEGKMPFSKSLKKRLELFSPTKNDIKRSISILRKNITPSVKRNKTFFKEYAENIYIISGGFEEYIIPIVKPFGISESHVLANSFTFNKKGIVTGYDTKKPLSKNGGKVIAVNSLNIDKKIVVIGDGITDYEISKKNNDHDFYAFTENVYREAIAKKAHLQVKNFDEFLFHLRLPRALSYPKSRMKVLLLENIDVSVKEKFVSEGYEVESLPRALSEKELIDKIKDITILGIRSKTEITAEVIRHSKKLLAVGAFCIGVNQIDLSTCTKKGIVVFNAPYSNTRSVVELVIGEIIMLSRYAVDKSNKLHKGVWDKSAKNSHEIRGKKLGIIGYGSIGTQLSVIAEALGMDVYFYDAGEKLSLGNAHKCESLDELCKIADVISVHVDGRKSNTNLIGEKEFKKMKDGVIFLNLSRGFIVDIEALAVAIKNKKIRGAAVDVFPEEPKSNDDPFVSDLQNLPNVILTPHIGGSTEEAQKNIGNFVSERLNGYIDEGITTLSVNFPHLQLPEQKNSHRFIHIHKNVPGVLAKINALYAEFNINIEGQFLGTNSEIGYVITDIKKDYNNRLIHALKKIPETIKLRMLY